MEHFNTTVESVMQTEPTVRHEDGLGGQEYVESSNHFMVFRVVHGLVERTTREC